MSVDKSLSLTDLLGHGSPRARISHGPPVGQPWFRTRILESGASGGDPALDPFVADPPSGRHVGPGTEPCLLVVLQLRVQGLFGGSGSGRSGRSGGPAGAVDRPPFLDARLQRVPQAGSIAGTDVDLVGPVVQGEPDGLVCISPVDVVGQLDNYGLGHGL